VDSANIASKMAALQLQMLLMTIETIENRPPLQLAVKLQQLYKDVSRGGDVRHTNSDVFETGRQYQVGLQLFRSRRGSRHNRPNFLFKRRVPDGCLQGLGVFNLDPGKAGEN